jgi:mono/diheme cytochrome c family protein
MSRWISVAVCASAICCVNTGQQIPPGGTASVGAPGDPGNSVGGVGANGSNNTVDPGMVGGGTTNPATSAPGNGGGGGGSIGSTPPAPMPGTMNDPSTLPPAQVTSDAIPADIYAILQARCSACHTYGQGDLGGWGSALDLSRMVDAEIVVPGNPNASRLIDRVVVRGDMPPRGDRVPAGEVDKLRAWIMGLRRPLLEPRTDEDVLDEISADVLKLRSLSSDFRYFSLAHFIDMGRPEKEVTVAKNLLAYVVNSLSRRGTIVPMVPVDSRNSVFRVRLSDLGWSAATWDQLTGFYPYCLASDLAGHQSLYAQLGTEAPFVRGDWFWDTGSRAPLYDILVDLPATLNDLARRLGVNIANDINHPGKAEPDNLVRFAVQRSGVSLHNRMAERHLGTAGQYLWISYDFKTDTGRQDIFANPLGPRIVDQQRFVHTFDNDAGEVIFSLPNGLQGYMLVNAAGNKLAVADTAIVRDIRRPNAVVENGISCFGCHGNGGMIRPRRTDEMRTFISGNVSSFQVREFQEITALYPPVFMPDVFVADSARYRGIADSLDGGGPPRSAFEYSELVALAGEYESNLGFRGAAAEFNQDPSVFIASVTANDPQNRTFPRTTADPLVSRVDMVCAWRDLAPKIEAKRFCNKTFNAAAVRGLCP